jgi:hypothetical protein
MKLKFVAALAAGVFCCSSAWAAPRTFHTNTCPLTLNGVHIGAELTPGGSSLRNTVAWEPATGLYHFWGFTADDPNFPSAASALTAVTHATSSDGVNFTRDTNLSYGNGSASYTTFGATIDPPLDFFRAAFDDSTGTWKLFNWTENDQVTSPSFGQYNYNTSVNDLGQFASNTAVVHQGPLNSPVAGNHVGTFGLVNGQTYLRIDEGAVDGGLGRYAYVDGMPPATDVRTTEANLFIGTAYCWFLDPDCGTAADPRIPAYVHNVGRTLSQSATMLASYYTIRHVDGSRTDKQIWYIESSDNGITWSDPVGAFADGSAVTIAGQPLDAATDSADFSSVDAAQVANLTRLYFSTQDAGGNYIMVATSADGVTDRLFANAFEGCDD